MTQASKPALLAFAAAILLVLVAATAYWLGMRSMGEPDVPEVAGNESEVLYWYDPMVPDKHFEQPGKSPFMDMQLIPKYADDGAPAKAAPLYWYDPMVPDKHFDQPGKSPFMDMQLVPKYPEGGHGDGGVVSVDSATLQNLGVRTAQVEVGTLSAGARVPGSIAWDMRSAYEINARADGVIEKLFVRAPYEPVRRGQALAELVAPEWSSAAQEYLALGRAGSADARALQGAARNRLRVLGMDEGQIRSLRGGNPRVVLRAPTDGVVSMLGVRQGQRVQVGMPLMTVNGLDTVWVEAAVPQAQAAGISAGTLATVRVSAFPGEAFEGEVEALLPDLDATTRTQRARIVLDNPGRRLVPGMFAEVTLAAALDVRRPLVPDDALITTGADPRVIVAEGEGRFRPVRVATGRSAGGRTEILRGLQGGERVVVSGQFLIDSEASLSGALERLSAPPPGSRASAKNQDDGKAPMGALQSKPAREAGAGSQADKRSTQGMPVVEDRSATPRSTEPPR